MIAPPPPVPPEVEFPSAGEKGEGIPAADLDRLLSAAFRKVGLQSYDADLPASPTNLPEIVVSRPDTERLAVWALGDSLWLDRDWWRPGETNVVSLSDHVGAVRDPHSIETVGRFFAGSNISGDERSWRGLLVSAIRYTFEPWRP